MHSHCQSVCSVSECQLPSSARYPVVVSAGISGAISSAIGVIPRIFLFVCTVNTDLQHVAIPSHSYIAVIHVQHSTSLLSENWLMAGRLTDWLTDRLTYWLTDWQTDWLTDWLTDWQTDWLTYWQTDRLTDWLTVSNVRWAVSTVITLRFTQRWRQQPAACTLPLVIQ